MKIDLHSHTNHSFDCKTRVEDLVRNAEQIGLDAIAITDHGTLSAVEMASGLARNILIIPGIEVSSWKGTHIIGLFIKDEITSRDIIEIIIEIHDQGGLAVIPHPFRQSSGLLYGKEKHKLYSGEDIHEILSLTDLVEVVNFGCKLEENMEANTFFDAFPDIAQIGGSDAHEPSQIGKAYIDLDLEKTDNLNNVRKALLTAPRIIRYEAYDPDMMERKFAKYIEGPKKGIISEIKNSFQKIKGLINKKDNGNLL